MTTPLVRVNKAAVQTIIQACRPTTIAETRRSLIIHNLHTLILKNLGWTLLPYGSTALKTYLPHGDIDLTAVSAQDVTPHQIQLLVSLLQTQTNQMNDSGLPPIKAVKFIDAKVKIVKCIVGDIPVDISFNQISGLSTLCFLEHVDQIIGRNHLFKESVILVKGWCYYESRTLGSHCGLLSTYGLEVLVMYIINHFHLSLKTPLWVLYTFLAYFSSFDWNGCCISILGPVRKSDLTLLLPQSSQNQMLITRDKLLECWDMFLVPKADTDMIFEASHNINIIDPLYKENNLGRSINEIGPFFRLRSAFRYGALKLERILRAGQEVKEVEYFFRSTLFHTSRDGLNQVDPRIPEPLNGNWLRLLSNLYFACEKHGYIPPLLPDLVSEAEKMELGDRS